VHWILEQVTETWFCRDSCYQLPSQIQTNLLAVVVCRSGRERTGRLGAVVAIIDTGIPEVFMELQSTGYLICCPYLPCVAQCNTTVQSFNNGLITSSTVLDKMPGDVDQMQTLRILFTVLQMQTPMANTSPKQFHPVMPFSNGEGLALLSMSSTQCG
jgi:hypothetical protein